MIGGSVDVGRVNFAQYFEEFDETILEELNECYKNLDKSMQRKTKGPMNDYIEDIISRMYTSSKVIQFGVYDLREDKSVKSLDIGTRKNLFNHLRNFYDLIERTDIFIIEQQFFNTFASNGRRVPGGGANVDAIKVAECLFSWISINFPFKEVYFFSSTFKTQILGAPYKLTKPQRKKWAIEKAISIFEIRGDDPDDLRIIKKKNSKSVCDDICDACVQFQAFKFKEFIGKF